MTVVSVDVGVGAMVDDMTVVGAVTEFSAIVSAVTAVGTKVAVRLVGDDLTWYWSFHCLLCRCHSGGCFVSDPQLCTTTLRVLWCHGMSGT